MLPTARGVVMGAEAKTKFRLWLPRSRGARWAAVLLAGAIFTLLVLLSHALDATLRGVLERNINSRLQGYRVSLGGAHLELIGLGLSLQNLVVRQQANPEPPVAAIPRLRAGVEWRELLTFHLVGDATFVRPSVHIDLPQLRQEARAQGSLKDRGWQQALEAIYPLKFNRMQVIDGSVVYIDQDPHYPYVISHLELTAGNIRNIHSREHTYPSPVSATGVLFDSGRASLEGNADFLAEPFPGVHANYRLVEVPLDRLRPIVSRANLELHGGILASRGEIEYAPTVKLARVVDLSIRNLRLDYVHTAATAEKEKATAETVASAARRATREPGLTLRLDRLQLESSELGFVQRSQPAYRLYLDRASVTVANLSNHEKEQGPAVARVRGRFQGSGAAHAEVRFHPGAEKLDFALDGEVVDTQLPALNDVLRAYSKLDVAGGRLSVYSQVQVQNGQIRGYVKPLLADLKFYDPKQDKDKPLGKKIVEKIAGGVAKLLEN
ncbi:MAG TPA: DUF748 domain-containing protein, partial [Thermoanaerobaculia bacterium]